MEEHRVSVFRSPGVSFLLGLVVFPLLLALLLLGNTPLFQPYLQQLQLQDVLLSISTVQIQTLPISNRSSSSSSSSSSSCCLECDIAELKIEGTRLLGCPQLDQTFNPAFLGKLASSNRPVWVATIGDSVLRNPFTTMPEAIMGRRWRSTIRGYNKSWYHNDQVFCCESCYDTSTCMYGRQAYEFEERVDKFVQKFLSSTKLGCCWSFTFTGLVETVAPLIREFLEQPLAPAMLITNPGLHHTAFNGTADSYHTALLKMFQYIIEGQRNATQAAARTTTTTTPRTRFVFHSTTMLNDSRIKFPNNHLVIAYNEATKDIVNQLQGALADADIIIVDGYRLTSMGDVHQLNDGVHYFGHYLDIVNALHANFLLHKDLYGFCSSRFFWQDWQCPSL